MPRHPRTRALVRLAAACFLLIPSAAPAADGARDLLRRVAENYRRARRFQFEGELRTETGSPSEPQNSSATFRAISGGGGRLRDELDVPGDKRIRVSDGSQSWLYMEQIHQYVHNTKPLPTPEAMDSTRIAAMGGMVGALLGIYRGIADGVDSARTLPGETVTVGRERRPCDVVRVRYKPRENGQSLARIYWIDRERGVVLMQRTWLIPAGQEGGTATQAEILIFGRATLDQPVPDSTFAFRVPANATPVDRFSQPGQDDVDLTGQMAADFKLPDLAGRPHGLAEQHGKVVMLDFWATWCGPCRMQMPAVDKLYQEFKRKGLVVYAVNQGESAERAGAYLAKHAYKTTALLDQKGDVSQQYGVRGIPTLVIIDRNGRIVAHWVGVHPEGTLREGLRKAGIQ